MTGSRRHTRLHVAPGVAPIVAQLMAVVARNKVNITHLGQLSGVSREMVYRWAKGGSVRLHDLEAVAEVLGMRVVLEYAPTNGGEHV